MLQQGESGVAHSSGVGTLCCTVPESCILVRCRAAAASSVAQQAACQKSEVVLQEAVSRAERAQAEADQAVKQAAEAAAYASAHQEVSGSQAAVSEHVCASPHC